MCSILQLYFGINAAIVGILTVTTLMGTCTELAAAFRPGTQMRAGLVPCTAARGFRGHLPSRRQVRARGSPGAGVPSNASPLVASGI